MEQIAKKEDDRNVQEMRTQFKQQLEETFATVVHEYKQNNKIDCEEKLPHMVS